MLRWLVLELRRLLPRIFWLLAFGGLFIASALAARVIASDEGHVEFDRVMGLGGYPLVSALLLAGWVVGRFPLIAALVLTAGIYSRDHDTRFARILATRARRPLLLLAARLALALGLALGVSAIVLPTFDMIMLGRLPGAQIIALATAYVVVFGALTALLSTLFRRDVWVAVFLAVLALVWHAVLRSGWLPFGASPVRALLTVLLPPQGALEQLEIAFGSDQAVPGFALLYCLTWATLALVLAGVAATRREL